MLLSKEKRKEFKAFIPILFELVFQLCLITNITLQLKFFSLHFIEPKIQYSFYSEVVIEVRVFVKEFEK